MAYAVIKFLILLCLVGRFLHGLQDDIETIKAYLKALPNDEEELYATIIKCMWEGVPACQRFTGRSDPLEYRFIQKFLPLTWCGWDKNTCRGCIVNKETRMIFGEEAPSKLVPLFDFHISLNTNIKGDGSFLTCKQGSLICSCSKNVSCAGDERYCSKVSCDHSSLCRCTVKSAVQEIATEYDGVVLKQPNIYSYYACIYKPGEAVRRRIRTGRRTLLSAEEKVIVEGNEIFTFNKPVLHVNASGILIIRKHGIETTATISEHQSLYEVPDELLLHEGILHVILVTEKGKMVEANFHIDGGAFCPRLDCLICRKAMLHFSCIPSILQYIIVTVVIILTGLFLAYIKLLLKAVYGFFYGLGIFFYILYRLCKGSLRITVLYGAIFGDRLRGYVQNVREGARALINQGGRMADRIPLVLLTIILFLPLILSEDSYCTNRMLLTSEVRNCLRETEEQGMKCQITTKGQVTLENLEHTSCLWITDATDTPLFKIRMTFESVKCNWVTKRVYFTFPTSMRIITQNTCPNNGVCGWGEHCYRGVRFAAEQRSEEANSYPGINDCFSAPSASTGCFFANVDGCAHYRWYLIPDYENVFEVRQIISSMCVPLIEVAIETNGSLPRKIKVQGTHTIDKSIVITTVGTYHQSTVSLEHRYLITKVTDKFHAYVEHAAHHDRPKYREVGDVQAENPFSKTFIFDEKIIHCARYHTGERDVQCNKIDSYLHDMIARPTPNKLPKVEGNVLLSVDKEGELVSQLMTSAPLVVHLELQNYKITLETAEVCPKIVKVNSYLGCFACATMAVMKFTAISTCLPGTAGVSFQKIRQYTPGIVLLQTETEYAIQISTEYKCVTDNLCVTAGRHKSCEPVEFCLDDPVIKLYQGNVSSQWGGSAFESASFSGGMSGWLSNIFSLSWLGLGSIVSIIAIVAAIPIISCCITFFKKK